MPRIVEIINCSMASNVENAPVISAVTAILKEIIPAASFNSDSPSKIVNAPLGNIFPLVIACTATASVGHKMAAIAKAAGIGNSGQIHPMK